MKVKVIQGGHELWYSDRIGKVFSVEEKLACEGWYRLTGEYGEGARLLRVNDVVQIKDGQPKFPFKVKCIDDGDAESYLTVGKVYVVTKMYLDEDYYIDEVGGYWGKRRFEIIDEGVVEQPVSNKYMREVKPGVWVDVYDVIRAWNVVDPCLQHLLKKALASGQRGHKDLKEDLDDILASAKRAVEMHEEWNKQD
jgi:hypothetical protein